MIIVTYVWVIALTLVLGWVSWRAWMADREVRRLRKQRDALAADLQRLTS